MPTLEQQIPVWMKLWAPKEELKLSEWAEKYFKLSSEYSARTGDLHLYGWQRDILDSFTDKNTERITLMCGTQLIKTLFIQVSTAYAIVQEPGPILIVQPKEPDADTFSKERLAPMIRDIPALKGKIEPSKSRDSNNTILNKLFPNGSITLVGAIAPGNLARRAIRYLFFDEIDKYPVNAGGEGDPVNLGIERTVTFGYRKKIIAACSPTIDGKSRIQASYELGDMRQPWVPCPFCGEKQILTWEGVYYDTELPLSKQSASARYKCKFCSALWNDNLRQRVCNNAEWRAQKPFAGHASFWISHLYSPWKKLSDIVSAYLDCKDKPEQHQVFVNTTLAETYKEPGERPEWLSVKGKAEPYPHGVDCVLPTGVVFLTASVDQQIERLEVEVVGWGRGKQNWSVHYEVIAGKDANGKALQATDPILWERLDKILKTEWQHESGAKIPILVMAIDTGDRPKSAYEFARRHLQPSYGAAGIKVLGPRTVVCVKGYSLDSLKLIARVSNEDAARKRQNVRIVSIGTSCAKQQIYDSLKMNPNEDGSFPDDFIHNPVYEDVYFKGLCAEVRKTHANGKISWETEYPRNEPLDLKVYNKGAAAIVGIDFYTERNWLFLEQQFGIAVKSIPEPVIPTMADPLANQPTPAKAIIETSKNPVLRSRVSPPTHQFGREGY